MKVQNIGLPVNHYGLNKFGAKNADYKIILNKLLEVIKPVVPQKQHSAEVQNLRKFACILY